MERKKAILYWTIFAILPFIVLTWLGWKRDADYITSAFFLYYLYSIPVGLSLYRGNTLHTYINWMLIGAVIFGLPAGLITWYLLSKNTLFSDLLIPILYILAYNLLAVTVSWRMEYKKKVL